jgi:prepilin-type N-terminal cleavage/methylation domain-containing protein
MNRDSPGFSLIELLVVIVITGVLMVAVTQVLITQQRGYRQQTAVVNARQSSRTVLDLLAVELRELSAADGDLLIAEEELVQFRAYRKLGIACEVELGVSIKVEEFGDVPFENSDFILVYHEESDGWAAGQVQSAAEDEDGCGRVLNVGSLAASDVALGAPVRGFEEYGYGLFDLEKQWMLGRRNRAGDITALVGPLAPPDENGLRFVYYDQAGTELSPPLSTASRAQVARIEIAVKGKSLGAGTPSGEHLDSLSMQVYLRGN